MIRRTIRPANLARGLAIVATALTCVSTIQADPLLNFQFNEGTGTTTTDSVSSLVGVFGSPIDPAVDTVQLVDQSPSGQAGDRAIQTSGAGFLLADDSATKALAVTNGPITLETWVFIDPNLPAKTAEGFIAYGNSFKMGMLSGVQVFTLYGIVDVRNDAAGAVPAGQWVHLAAAWDPGVGVHFYVDGVEYFVEDTHTAARPPLHNYLSLGSEGLGNNSIAIFDRMRVHNALLTADQIDSVAATPKAPVTGTLVNYQFNETSFPANSTLTPSYPTVLSSTLLPEITGPEWTNDTPSGAANDFALAFLTETPPVKEVVTVDYGATPVDLSVNNNSYTLQTWVKLPTAAMEERRVIFRTEGPAPRIALSINANRTLHTTVIGTADFTTSVAVPNDARWHHIAVTMDNFDQLRFYLDGVLRQTVTRTQTGAPTAGGTPRLLIGKESETRYFRGVLDRVIINNDALARTALDYPAAAGRATFDSLAAHPTNVVTDAGQTVNFTAIPTSATPITGQQWFYRTNLADQVGVPISGATGNLLTLNNVTAENQGFYYLVVTNAAGSSESYAAELTLRSEFALPPTGFEAPTYTSGPLEGQERWTTDQNGNIVRVRTATEITNYLTSVGLTPGQTVHSGDQALLIAGPGVATATTRRIGGLESEKNVSLDFWARPLTSATIGNVFVRIENAAGIGAAAVRFGPANSIDYGTEITGVWQASGLTWDADTWYHIAFEIDYEAKTYNFLVNGTVVNSAPIPLYDKRSDSLYQIRIFRGASQAGVIIDDLAVTSPDAGGEPTLNVARQGSDLTISWPAADTGFILQGTDSLTTPNWATVTHTTVGTDNQAVVQTNGTMRFFRLITN
jgi:hypothetical protein